MTPERWRQIEELYHAARERAPEDRAALLAQADPELRREVEAMLAQDASGGKILDRPAEDLLTDSTLAIVAAGSQLGPYRIEALLGAGGLGKVLQAVDTRLGRKVAIKVSAEQFSVIRAFLISPLIQSCYIYSRSGSFGTHGGGSSTF